jgi:hypothetical protein
LHYNPYFFRTLIEALLLNPQLSADDALLQVRERIATDLGYPRTWLSLTPLQREVAGALARGVHKPYSQAARGALGTTMSTPPPSAAQVQTALRKLSKLGVADTYTGTWALEDPEFARWIKAGH